MDDPKFTVWDEHVSEMVEFVAAFAQDSKVLSEVFGE